MVCLEVYLEGGREVSLGYLLIYLLFVDFYYIFIFSFQGFLGVGHHMLRSVVLCLSYVGAMVVVIFSLCALKCVIL